MTTGAPLTSTTSTTVTSVRTDAAAGELEVTVQIVRPAPGTRILDTAPAAGDVPADVRHALAAWLATEQPTEAGEPR